GCEDISPPRPHGRTAGLLYLRRHVGTRARCLLDFDFRISRNDGFRHLPKTGKELLDLFAALLKIGNSSRPNGHPAHGDTNVAEQLHIARAKPIPHLHRSIVVEHLLAPGIGGNYPEDSLSMKSALDQRSAAIDRERPGDIANL